MISPYAYTPYIWPSALTVLLTLAMAIYCDRHRRVPGVLPFLIGNLFAAAWAAGSVMETTAVGLATKIFWIKFETVWQLPAVTAMTCFVLEYAWPGRWLTRRNLALLSIAPLLVLGLILSEDLHHLLWSGFQTDGSLIPQLGPGSWVAILYSFGLVILSISVLTWLFLHSPQHRWPVVMMVTGHIGSRVLYVLGDTILLHSQLPFDVISVAFLDSMYAIALFAFRIFDPIPLALQAVIPQMREGMLVLDLEGRIASLNPAAERILQMPAKVAKGRAVRDLLPASLKEMPETPEEYEIEFTLGAEQGHSGPPVRYCTLAISQLKDWRGMEAGRLLLLRDVTRGKQAEAALNESREIQRLIFEKSFDGISMYEERPDEDQRILVDCNERYCQMAGRSKEELLAIQDTRLIQRIENPVENSDRASVMTEKAFSGVFSWLRPDGKENIIEYNAAPIRVEDRFYTIGVDRDMTESRRTQARFLEQQRALATLKEREQVARELHDELAQELALVNVQAQIVDGLLEVGQNEQARTQLQRLAKIARETHVDVRGQIGELSLNMATEAGFLGFLVHSLKMFQQTYGIKTELVFPGTGNEISFTPTVELQLLRIVQEALTNIRKHAQAKQVQVTLTREPNCVDLVIADDGVGFDPDRLPTPGRSFGLGIISKRVEEINARLEVKSAPGKGTKILVEVPVNHEQ